MDHLKTENNADILEIKETCAVLLIPDSIAMSRGIEKIYKQYRDDEILPEIGADEAIYRERARNFCSMKGLKVIETDKKILLFINQKGEKNKVENTLEGVESVLYLFDNQKQPYKVENLSTFSDGKEFEAYFSNAK